MFSFIFCFEFLGVISSVNIAGVVREGKFAGHLINNDTELVFMDEWTADSLSCEDAKRILQGGSLHIPQKHAEASKIYYSSGFFITTNVLPDFGQERDQNAIQKRLRVFQTRALPKKMAAYLVSEKVLVYCFIRNVN